MKLYNKISKTKRYTLSTMMLLFLMGCGKREQVILSKDISSFSKFPDEYDISFNNLFEYKKGRPATFRLVDSTLILFNRSKGAEAFFYNYDLAKGKLSKAT